MLKFITDLRSSFWFIPALVVILAAVLAVVAVELDALIGGEALAKLPRLFGARAEGARELLSTIAGSTITVAGVVFSITIVALSMAASQYSPRVLRGFMRDRANQLVLGVFVGVYVYCLIVLRTVRGGEDAFVPGISVLVALAFALTGVGFLIFFIHHIASSIQVSEIAARIAGESIEAMRAQSSAATDADGESDAAAPREGQAWQAVHATSTGYIQGYDPARLIAWARHEKRAISMLRTTGDFVVAGEGLLTVTGGTPGKDAAADLNSAYAINTYRDITQDPAFGVHQLVDIALKALSPGVNDTATARNSLDYLTSILLAFAEHPIPAERHIVEDGQLRLIVRNRPLAFYIESTFDPIRRNAIDNVDMMLHALQALERVARALPARRCHDSIAQQLASIDEVVAAAQYTRADRAKLVERMQSVQRALDTAPV